MTPQFDTRGCWLLSDCWHLVQRAMRFSPAPSPRWLRQLKWRIEADGTVLRPAGCADRLRQSEKSRLAFPVQNRLPILVT
jgi:hypothetical protein